MQSLRDKLLKAGLVTEEAAKKVESEKSARPARAPERPARPERHERHERTERSERPEHARGPRHHDAPPRSEPRVPKLPPLQGTREANRQASRAQLELDRRLREMVLAAQVPLDVGATTFYFVTRKQKLRRMSLTEAQAKLLQEGQLAVVERPDPDKIEHALVPPEVARAMKALSERAVRFLNDGSDKVGFLSDEEISRRASEADEKDEAPTAAAEPSTPADTATEPAPSAEPTFITIKRAPLAG